MMCACASSVCTSNITPQNCFIFLMCCIYGTQCCSSHVCAVSTLSTSPCNTSPPTTTTATVILLLLLLSYFCLICYTHLPCKDTDAPKRYLLKVFVVCIAFLQQQHYKQETNHQKKNIIKADAIFMAYKTLPFSGHIISHQYTDVCVR